MTARASEVISPSVGMLATVRNRRGIVTSVEPFDGHDGRLHLVTVEYTDPDGVAEDQLIWEREAGARVVPPAMLPDITHTEPMPADDFDALVRATRWTAISPFLDPDGPEGPLDAFPIASPFHGAIQVDDFQLVPVLKALRMPRVSLLLADDVGLGKTVEAGLVLTELLIRRRIRRVLVLCPASLRSQWRQELAEKFSLPFDEVDREATHALRKTMGMDVNPWRTFPRIIASYYYLRQPDVLEEFVAAARPREGSPHLPWDLLVVDEAHNLTPAPYGDDSDLSKMLARIAPYFEHKLFLTATPHNGHTRSFTGLLERLDPLRFTQSSELKGAARGRIEDVVVRRLKREINAVTQPPRFCEREVAPLPLTLPPEERALSSAFQAFRTRIRSLIADRRREEQTAGAFAVEILGKRLLSCPVAFADSWHRYLAGAREDEAAEAGEVRAAERATREEMDDDLELEGRTAHASRVVGAWLKPYTETLSTESTVIDEALVRLGLGNAETLMSPAVDSRLEAFFQLVESRLRRNSRWRDDERLVVFTEYKTTLDYLQHRVMQRYPQAEEGVLRVLYGGMPQPERDSIKAAFNNRSDPVRILLATDAAAEGLNLHETARYLLHYDVPWNPSRLEQRNGRLDRHGQARNVVVFHYATDDDEDLKFLAQVVDKVETIRDDLGSVGEVFDAGLRRRLIEGRSADNTWGELERAVDLAKGRAETPRDRTLSTEPVHKVEADAAKESQQEVARLAALQAELDLTPDALRDTLEAALSIHAGRPRFEAADERGRLRLVQPLPSGWTDLIDDTLRREGPGKAKGPLPALVFDPDHFIHDASGRPIFRPDPETTLVHLGHPLFQRALAAFSRLRYPGGDPERRATRWTVRRGAVPENADALLLLTIEELAVNELRESIHHWVRTCCVPLRGERLLDPLPHRPALELRVEDTVISQGEAERARALWDEVEPETKSFVSRLADDLTHQLGSALEKGFADARRTEQERFTSRQRELSALLGEQSLARLRREIERRDAELRQIPLLDAEAKLQELLRSKEALEEELRRRQIHLTELREQLGAERERVLERLLPRRYRLRGAAQCFPVAVEIRLPGRPA